MKKTSKKNVIITGSEGLIGKILCQGLVNYNLYKLDKIKKNGSNYYQTDIANKQQLLKAIEKIKTKINCIVHLAAASGIYSSWQQILKSNIIGTNNIYEIAKEKDIKKIVFFSTNHITGGYEGNPRSLHLKKKKNLITTKHAMRPDSYYAVSKIFGEALARMYYEQYQISTICLRIGNVITNDDPRDYSRSESIWLSHRDLICLTDRAIKAAVGFGIYYGISNNTKKIWEINNTIKELGYKPKDNASKKINYLNKHEQ